MTESNNRTITMAAEELSPVSLIRRGPCHDDPSCRRGCGREIAAEDDRETPATHRPCYHDDGEHGSKHDNSNTDNSSSSSSRIRRKRPFMTAIAMTAVIAATSITADAFSPLRRSPFPPSSLAAVHKRSGNHDMSARAAAIAASRTSLRTAESPAARGRNRNAYDQFAPAGAASPYDADMRDPAAAPRRTEERMRVETSGPAAATRANRSRILKSNRINLRLRSLLKDDTGEQEMERYPDHSPEAAEQLAELKSYSKMSEEARRKANAAVKANDEGEEEVETSRVVGNGKRRIIRRRLVTPSEDDASANRVTLAPTSNRVAAAPRKRVVRATVKETGADSMNTYIKSLGQHELLFKDDEFLLGRQVRMLTVLEEKRHELEEDLLRPPTFLQWAESTNHTVPSLKQQIRRSQRAKAALIEANLRLVITVARQAVKKSPVRTSASPSSVQFQDACQQGIIGLTRATEKFNPELGFRFSTYAIWWIQKEVARNVNEQSRSVRVPQSAMKKINDIRIQERLLMSELNRKPNDDEVAERVGMSLAKLQFYKQSANGVSSLDKKIDARTGKGSMSTGGDSGDGATMDVFVKDTDHPSPSELIDEQMLKEDIRRLVRTLAPREQAVIRLRFGLDDGKPLGLTEISAKFGVDKARIKKIETSALLKLRQPERSHVVQSYVSDHT